MEVISNVDLLFVGVTIASIGILGFIVFFSDRKSSTNRAFLFFALITIFWSTLNYANYQAESAFFVLWLLRLAMFFAVWHSFSFFPLSYIFPKKDFGLSNRQKFILMPVVVITSILTLTPVVFSGIAELSPVGQVSKTTVGWGIYLFGFVVVSLLVWGVYSLFKKTR